jgi:hypothetical protein
MVVESTPRTRAEPVAEFMRKPGLVVVEFMPRAAVVAFT